MDFIDDRCVIWSHDNDLPLVEKVYVYEGRITPNRVIKNKNVYEVTHINPLYIMNGFMLITEQDFVKTITLFGYHPNRDPETNLYCLPDYKKGVIYNEQYFDMLLTNIKTYYLDNCFFIPGKTQVTYKKLKSVYIKLNKGD
jgi:hypothetical protein